VTCLSPPQREGDLGSIEHFHVVRLIGEGSNGLVFEAEDSVMGRRVAIKVMRPEIAGSQTARIRFVREARAGGAVVHENVVPVYQIGEIHGLPYLAMPFLVGETLEDRLKRQRPLPADEIIRIGREAAEGLAAAHAVGLTHRDVKPANLWLEEGTGRVKLLDFGLAQAAAEDAKLTATGAFIGTPAYVAPEQARNAGSVDGRSDLFSLGAVLYEAAAGRRAFEATGLINLLYQVAHQTPPPPATVNHTIPAALSQLIMRLLEKEPSRRPTSARAVADELIVMSARTDPWKAVRWALLGVVAAGLFAIGALAAVVGVWLANRPSSPPAVQPQANDQQANDRQLARSFLAVGDQHRAQWWQDRHLDDAQTAYKRALRLDPNLAAAQVGLAAILAADPVAVPQQAAEAANLAEQADPASPLARVSRALARARAGQRRPSEEDLALLVPPSGGPDAALVQYLRGQTLARNGQAQAAIDAYRQVLALQPNASLTRIARGDAYLDLDSPAEALAEYDAVLALDENNTAALLGRGRALLHRDRPADALRALNQALKTAQLPPIHPLRFALLEARTAAHEQLGHANEAQADRRELDRLRSLTSKAQP
jgi:tetratricopeptide (TPR) repeat protein/tRNA A-37 threonylcarbamoyl transferase component Bud32